MSKDLRAFTVCFTGHRELHHKDIPGRLDTLPERLIKNDYIKRRVRARFSYSTPGRRNAHH